MITMKEQRKAAILSELINRIANISDELFNLSTDFNFGFKTNMQIRKRAQKCMRMADVFVNRFEDIFVSNNYDTESSMFIRFKGEVSRLNDNIKFFL